MSVYNPTIGYADLNALDSEKAFNTVSFAKKIIEEKNLNLKIENIFVAGCGEGTEAVLLQQIFNKYVYGIDISLKTEIEEEGKIKLKKGNLMSLDLPDNSFDFIYSYHVLEHVPDPSVVLKGLCRVLKDDGLLFIGFPNKNRLVGYIGSHNTVSLAQKIKWNLKDYGDRLLGRFKNELGAHAGFTNKEFLKLGHSYFNTISPVRNEYMLLKYSKYNKIINFFIKVGISEFLFPSNYYLIKKKI
jgi:ubiquinone/menaquinone biosynthesis C-methylase UbiE